MFHHIHVFKAYKFIFTSPTSAQDINSEIDLENQAPRPLKRGRGSKAPTRGHIASLLGLRSVTPRSIAYIAVQVRGSPSILFLEAEIPMQLRFALSSAAAWNENDGCFSYPIFYNNILDFFEDTPGPAAQAHAQDLLSWWTRYCVILSILLN